MAMVSIIGGTPPAVAITYAANVLKETAGTSVTSSAQSIGAYDANRWTYVAISMRKDPASGVITSVTVDGISCVQIASIKTALVDTAEIWRVGTGSGTSLENDTTADIVVTVGTADFACAISTYKVVGGYGTASAQTVTEADPADKAIVVPAGGGAIGVYSYAVLTTGISWTNLTENDDVEVSATRGGHHSSASRVDAGGASVTVTADAAVGGFDGALAIAVIS